MIRTLQKFGQVSGWQEAKILTKSINENEDIRLIASDGYSYLKNNTQKTIAFKKNCCKDVLSEHIKKQWLDFTFIQKPK